MIGSLMGTKMWLRRFVAKKRLIRDYPDAQRLVEIHGAKILAGKGNKIEDKILSGQGYDNSNMTIVNALVRPGDICFDVGANIGVYSVVLAHLCGAGGKVHAFEPVEHVGRKLMINLQLNGHRNVKVNPIVLGDDCREMEMFQVKEGEYRGGTSTLTLNENVKSMGLERFDRDVVPMITADAYVEQNNLTRLDFVKVDIEGYELNFLKGARKLLRRLSPTLLMEHNQKRIKHLEIDEGEFGKLFDEAGYTCYEVLVMGGEPIFLPFRFDRKLKGINIVCFSTKTPCAESAAP